MVGLVERRTQIKWYLIRIINDVSIQNSRKYVSEKTGLTQGYISQILNGKHNPKLPTLIKAVDALGYDVTFEVKKR